MDLFCRSPLELLAIVYAVITLTSIFLTAFNLHIGFTSRYLRLVAAVFDYGQARIVAKTRSVAKISSMTDDRQQILSDDGRGDVCSADDQDFEDDSDDDDDDDDDARFESPISMNIDEESTDENCKPPEDSDSTLVQRVPSHRRQMSASKSADNIKNNNNANSDGQLHSEADKKSNDTTFCARRPAKVRWSTVERPRGGELNETEQQHPSPNSPDELPVFLLGGHDVCYSNTNTNKQRRPKRHFELHDACSLLGEAVTAIVDDQVTKRFYSRPLSSWNLLTRTNARHYQFVSFRVGLIWLLGCVIRYIVLLPLRIMFTLVGSLSLIAGASIISFLPEPSKSKTYRLISLVSFRMVCKGITAMLTFHNRQNKPKKGDICVANHTSPIDVSVLACDNCYAFVGQRHGGILGMLENILSRATKHVWFDRSEVKDRQLVLERLKEHVRAGNGSSDLVAKSNSSLCVEDSNSNKETYPSKNLPILVFPEGTCINNSAVMMFKKGSFEASDRICPIAIKYDLRFGDPFWNSSQQSYFLYFLMLMTSWAIKCDIWYLPAMTRFEDESSAEFANRVKHEIAIQGGLDDLAWDGQLKRTMAKEELKFKQQQDFASQFKLD